MSLPLFTCRPIGIIHTPHTDPAQTPRQPIHAADFTGQVEIFPEFAAGLEGLEHYVRIWLLFAFHRAEAPRLHVIPHGQTQERGVFTTRAPCRPGGIGMSLVANKIHGIRAACCSEPYSAKMTRLHNDANVLCIGARVIGEATALDILDAFLDHEFEGGRHAERVAMITAIEERG